MNWGVRKCCVLDGEIDDEGNDQGCLSATQKIETGR